MAHKVFISSVQREFAKERRAIAAAGVTLPQLDPIIRTNFVR